MSFGKKYVVFCGIISPRRRRSETCSIARRADEERRLGLAAVDGRHRLVARAACTSRPPGSKRSTRLDVELVARASEP